MVGKSGQKRALSLRYPSQNLKINQNRKKVTKSTKITKLKNHQKSTKSEKSKK